MQISELTIGGFQVFDKPTTFPLGPITLVYGPNSAGKSAIADALRAIRDVCVAFHPADDDQVSEVDHALASALDRHWRICPGDRLTLAEEVCLGVKVQMKRSAWVAAGIADELTVGSFIPKSKRFKQALTALRPWLSERGAELDQLGLRMWFGHAYDAQAQEAKPQAVSSAVSFAAEVWINDIPLLAYRHWLAVAINLEHPALGGRLRSDDFAKLTEYLGGCAAYKDGWFGLTGDIHLMDRGLDVGSYLNQFEPNFPSEEVSNSCYSCGFALGDLFDALWHCSTILVEKAVDLTTVPASRTIPTKAEVTFLKDEFGHTTTCSRHGIVALGREDFDWLAMAAVRSALRSSIDHEEAPADDGIRGLLTVNRLLAEDLFIEKGYCISADITPLVNNGDLGGAPTRRQEFLVTLVLSDPEGRRFAFDEVGSGLGYALPVLLAISSSRSSFVQQPELHLHPALQSAMADAFLASLGGDSQHIVETHSEHLLLRMLKRIRQGRAAGRSQASERVLSSSELVVLYVNPSIDGSSTVKHLRVSPEGEFIDRWPRGFFEERWKDVFDE